MQVRLESSLEKETETSEEKFELEFAKRYIANQSKFSSTEKVYIQKATSAGQIAILLFSKGLFNLYRLLNEHMVEGGITPTLEEMNKIKEKDKDHGWFWVEPSEQNGQLSIILEEKNINAAKEKTTGWFWLIQSTKGLQLLDEILSKDFCPNKIAFTVKYASEKKNLIEILRLNQYKLNQNLYKKIKERLEIMQIRNHLDSPSLNQAAQNLLAKADSISELWYFIFSNHYFSFYQELAAEGIYPTAEAMNQIQKNGLSLWHYLALSLKNCYIFLDLLQQDIYPDLKILALVSEENENLWSLLITYTEGLLAFKFLLRKGYLPNAEDLSLISKNSGHHVWLEICLKLDFNLFAYLIHKNRRPNPQDLSFRSKHFNRNTWLALASDYLGLEIIKILCSLENIPNLLI